MHLMRHTQSEGQDRTIVIGVGNPYRGGDGIGPAVARAISFCESRICEPTDLALCLHEYERVILVDAADGLPPGELYWWNRSEILTTRFETAGFDHGLSLIQALRLAAEIGRLPERTWLLGIGIPAPVVGEFQPKEWRETIANAVQACAIRLSCAGARI